MILLIAVGVGIGVFVLAGSAILGLIWWGSKVG